jgi:methyl-accepting chemotaxis protein
MPNALQTITVRFGLAIGSALLGLLAVMAAGVLGLTQLKTNIASLVTENTAKSDATSLMRLAIIERVNTVRNVALTAEVNAMQADIQAAERQAQNYAQQREKLLALNLSEFERASLAKADAAEAAAAPLLKQSLALARTMNGELAAATLTGKFAPVQAQWLEALSALSASAEADRAATLSQTQTTSDRVLTAMLATGALSFAVAVGLGYWVARGASRRLLQAVSLTQRIANGDLSQSPSSVDLRGHDEVAQTLTALNTMQGRLNNTFGSVRHSVQAINTASDEIAAGANDLSTRTEHSASSLQETASSLEQLTRIVKGSADNAAMAAQLAQSATDNAERGGSAVRNVVSTMDDISSSSRKIGEIISVIDGIAFQTNILALNAAVEAARAGEHGRGFAVVASEVRSLAHRSAQAAREIKTLVSTSLDKVDAGSRLVADAGTVMVDIVESVQRVNQVIGEISAAAAQQTSGISQINQAVSELDQMTQQNAALVEQSAAAAMSMREQTARLAVDVEGFKLSVHAA